MHLSKISLGNTELSISVNDFIFITDPLNGKRYRIARTGLSIHKLDGSVCDNYNYSSIEEHV